MSPGGLFSAAPGLAGWPACPPPEDDPPPQPDAARARTTAPTPSAARLDMRPPRNVEIHCRHRRMGGSARRPRQVNARSNLAGDRAPRGTVGSRVSPSGILLVEDDEAIASGLVRVLDSQ